jgi:hypothetical protein
MSDNNNAQPKRLPSKPTYPNTDCSNPLDLQQREPLIYWRSLCKKWFDEKLERI